MLTLLRASIESTRYSLKCSILLAKLIRVRQNFIIVETNIDVYSILKNVLYDLALE